VVEGGTALVLRSRGRNPTPVWLAGAGGGRRLEGGRRLVRRGEEVTLRHGDSFGLLTNEPAPGTVQWWGVSAANRNLSQSVLKAPGFSR
jgi:hypothetical protein